MAMINSPGYNGLSANSLLFNAMTQNPKALRILMDNPLNDALFDAGKHPYMSHQLADSGAKDVMDYIVSCALDRSARVTYDDPISHTKRTWDGEMGLCPHWGTEKPSEDCLQLVSSCLFARTNRLHSRVPVRFGFSTLPPPRDRVAVTTTYAKGDPDAGRSEGTEISAFSRGWKPGYVGSCAPNQPFTLSIPEPSRCMKDSIRVCQGIRGCDEKSTRFLGEKRGPCGDAPLTFTCPDEGFFGVMTTPNRVEVVHRGSGVGSYPAAEKDVFPFLEGAFFGNLFDPGGLARSQEMVLENGHLKPSHTKNEDDDAIPHRRIYACYSQANDEAGVAYLDARVCVKHDSKKKCFPNPPRRCHFQDADMNKRKGYHCKWRSDDGLYRECVGDDGVTYPSITVYLHEPCGLSESGCVSPLPKAPPN
jgi:hypothetical protein